MLAEMSPDVAGTSQTWSDPKADQSWAAPAHQMQHRLVEIAPEIIESSRRTPWRRLSAHGIAAVHDITTTHDIATAHGFATDPEASNSRWHRHASPQPKASPLAAYTSKVAANVVAQPTGSCMRCYCGFTRERSCESPGGRSPTRRSDRWKGLANRRATYKLAHGWREDQCRPSDRHLRTHTRGGGGTRRDIQNRRYFSGRVLN